MESKTIESELALVEYLGQEAYVATILFLGYARPGRLNS